MSSPERNFVRERRGFFSDNRNRIRTLIGVLCVGLIIGILIAVLYGPTNVCVSDQFIQTMFYTDDGTRVVAGYKFIEKIPGRRFYNFNESLKACEAFSSSPTSVWEVLGGNSEWQHFYGIANQSGFLEPTGSGIWINAKLSGNCPDGVPSRDCVADKAETGKGLKVIWPSTGETSSYSRLAGRDDSGENCVIVKGDLWETANCGHNYWTLCIRRDCDGSF